MGFVKRRLFPPDAPQQKIPVGGDFISAYVAPWSMKLIYTIMVDGDGKDLGADWSQTFDSGWTKLYYSDYSAASAAAKESNQRYGAQTIYRLQTKVTDIININDASVFSNPTMGFDIPTATMRKSKKFAAFQLVFIPSAVNAFARLYDDGKTDLPTVDWSALLDEDIIFDDAFFAAHCGNPDASPDDPDHWTKSIYGKQRQALWTALGENDIKKYTINAPRYVTKAPLLMATLQSIGTPWEPPVWACVNMGYDPRPDALKSNGDRLRLPIIAATFWGEKDARAYAIKEGLFDGSEDSDNDQPSQPALPKAWTELSVDEWVSALTEEIKSGKAKPALMSELDVTASELSAWKKHLNI